MTKVNSTHDPSLKSRVASANEENHDFPIQNLPFGVFSSKNSFDSKRVGVAIGDWVLDVDHCREGGLFEGDANDAAAACGSSTLNQLMALEPSKVSALRAAISALLQEGNEALDAHPEALIPQSEIDLHLPVDIGDYTDFYCSIHHATNIGSMFRPDNPLMPNYKHIPIGYHGRASSVVVGGTKIQRPSGQTKADDAAAPTYGPCKLFDYELEMGFFVGRGNDLGSTIPIGEAEDHLFGFCLMNDWSARDIQKWEYQPLGPFLAKSFATSISPWIVTNEALAPFRVPAFERNPEDPQPLPHLDSESNRNSGGLDLHLEVFLATKKMRDERIDPMRLSQTNFRTMYWTAAQMLTHHASNGCNLRPGDLLGSGTVSGPDKENRGCLLELTWRGSEPVELPTGEVRRFLQDGDEVIFRGACERDGAKRIGFGECRGVVAD